MIIVSFTAHTFFLTFLIVIALGWFAPPFKTADLLVNHVSYDCSQGFHAIMIDILFWWVFSSVKEGQFYYSNCAFLWYTYSYYTIISAVSQA